MMTPHLLFTAKAIPTTISLSKSASKRINALSESRGMTPNAVMSKALDLFERQYPSKRTPEVAKALEQASRRVAADPIIISNEWNRNHISPELMAANTAGRSALDPCHN